MTSREVDELVIDCGQLNLDDSTIVPVRKNHRTRDITFDFTNASKALGIGDLVKDEAFTLFESVQALEIMNPRMDTGLLTAGETLKDDYDVCGELLPAQVVWIMDQLLCYEMTWHRGYPLAQNLLTSMYIYNLLIQERKPNAMPLFRPLDGSSKKPGPLVQKVLRTFCIGIIKTCDVAIEVVQSQQYYEEEDLNTHTFGLDFLTDTSDDEYFQMNKDAEAWLRNPQVQQGMDPKLNNALLTRLSCRENFMNLILLNPQQTQSSPEDDITEYKAIVSSWAMEDSDRLREHVDKAFSGKLQRQLASTTPARPVVILDLESACREHYEMYEHIQEALRANHFGGNITMETLSIFLWAFSDLAPSTFARGMLQMALFNDGKIAGVGNGIQGLLIAQVRDIMIDPTCLQEAFWEVEAPTDDRFRVARAVDFFLERAGPVYIDVLRSLCQNRCRIRRCLINMIANLVTLLKDLTDENVKTSILASAGTPKVTLSFLIKKGAFTCTRLLLIQAAEWAIELGFEQEIYRPWEFLGLQYYLISISNEKNGTYRDFWLELLAYKDRIEIYTGRPFPHVGWHEWTQDSVWKGAAKLYLALSRLDATAQPGMPYSDAQDLFELRFEPFTAAIVELRHGVNTYVELVDPTPFTLKQLLDSAAEYLQTARARLMARLKRRAQTRGAREDLDAGITHRSLLFWSATDKCLLKALVKASVAVVTILQALQKVANDETSLKGKVTAKFDKPESGDVLIVPTIIVRLNVRPTGERDVSGDRENQALENTNDLD